MQRMLILLVWVFGFDSSGCSCVNPQNLATYGMTHVGGAPRLVAQSCETSFSRWLLLVRPSTATSPLDPPPPAHNLLLAGVSPELLTIAPTNCCPARRRCDRPRAPPLTTESESPPPPKSGVPIARVAPSHEGHTLDFSMFEATSL
jgi:hypothetical protein